MTDHPLYLPAPLIPAFMAGRVYLLVEPLDVLDGAHSPKVQFGSEVVSFTVDGGVLDAPLPHAPGDRLWLREAWSGTHTFSDIKPSERTSFVGDGWPYLREEIWYWADGSPEFGDWEKPRPPITMPKWASRAWGEVEDVDVKRVQDVTEAECKTAGFLPDHWIDEDGAEIHSRADAFRRHFTATHGPDAWDRNPWCTFTRIKPHVGSLEGKG